MTWRELSVGPYRAGGVGACPRGEQALHQVHTVCSGGGVQRNEAIAGAGLVDVRPSRDEPLHHLQCTLTEGRRLK